MNYENPASCYESLVFRDAVRRRALKGGSDKRRCRDGCGHGYALHGCAGTKRHRVAARSFETGRRPIVEENN